MEYNHVHHNANNAQGCGGPVGIWAYGSRNITIQFNEVDHMHVANWGQQCDVGAYDFDSHVFDSVMQYNYSHDNDGPGWLLHGNASNNTVRYNISVNDGLKNGPSAILNINGGGLSRVYNNIAIGPAAGFALAAYSYLPGSQVVNNIFITTQLDSFGRWFGGGPFPGADISNMDIRNNLYFNTVPGVAIRFTNNSFSLADWQAQGHELNTVIGDPRLLTAISSIMAAHDIVWEPTQHTGPQPAPADEKLRAGSPALGAGVAITNNGGRDYWGNAIGSPPNIGAYNGPPQ
jgi:hypothetical protein